jgi:hypothetical protein
MLKECPNGNGQETGIALVNKSIDEQLMLADAYRYGSMDAQETVAAFEANRDNIDKLVPEVSNKAAEARVAWDQLTPWLCRQRALLSQRGSERRQVLRRAKLPEWETYFTAVVASINCTISTVYRHMRQLEGAKSGTGRKPKPHMLTPLEQRLVDATVAAHEIVTAHRCPGANVDEAIQKFERVAPSPEELVRITSTRRPPLEPQPAQAATKVAKAQQLANQILSSPGFRPKAVEQLAREVLGSGKKAAPAGPKINHEAYGRELNHWKDTTKNFLRGVGLAQGRRKETETRECLVRFVKRLRTTTKKSSWKPPMNAVAQTRARASRAS